MKTVSVANLKNDLSRYLSTVHKGEEVIVTSHSHAVAKLVPYSDTEPLPVRSPIRKKSRFQSIVGVDPLKPVDPMSLLREDRDRR